MAQSLYKYLKIMNPLNQPYFDDKILGIDIPLNKIFYYHKINIEKIYQSVFMLINKRLRKEYRYSLSKIVYIHSKSKILGLADCIPELVELSLYESKLNNSDMHEINKLSHLEYLNFYDSNIDDKKLFEMNNKKLYRLKFLDLDGCSKITDKGILHIFDNFKNLKSLLLKHVVVQKNTFKCIDKLKFIKELKISIHEANCIKYIIFLEKLEILNLSVFAVPSDEDIMNLGKFTKIKKIKISDYTDEDEYNDLHRDYISELIKNDLLSHLRMIFININHTDMVQLFSKKFIFLELNFYFYENKYLAWNYIKNNIKDTYVQIIDNIHRCSYDDINIINYLINNFDNFYADLY